MFELALLRIDDELFVDFARCRLSRSRRSVEALGRVEVLVPQHDFQRLGGNTGIDQPLGAAPSEVVGAGVLQSVSGFFVGFLHDNSGLLADHADDVR